MLKKLLFAGVFLIAAPQLRAQLDPSVTSWIINTTGATGYSGIPTNVQQVQYSDTTVYISATCIPGYAIGPWTGNPNVAANQNFVYALTRHPHPNPNVDSLIPVGLGHVGVFTNGVSVFNTQDAHSYNNQGVWNQNAYFFEGGGFDDCLGHPQQQGEYHHHVSPKCLYDETDSTHHSPIIGFALDGYPIYGAYAYTNINGTGAIKRMRSGYQERVMTDRTTLPNGSVATYAGPAISSTYPIGAYQEDFVYTAGSGDLDANNGRYCVTPEYPNGIYAYFVTLDAALAPAYPYTLGANYYGLMPPGMSGHATITDSVQTYTPLAVPQVTNKDFSVDVFPNPATTFLHLFIQPIITNNMVVTLTDEAGRTVLTQKNIQPTIMYTFDVSNLAAGVYTVTIRNSAITAAQKIVIVK
jgi:hypothetical protein